MIKCVSLDNIRIIMDYLKINGATPCNDNNLLNKLSTQENKVLKKTLERIFQYLEDDGILGCNYAKDTKEKANTWFLKDKELLNNIMSKKDAINFGYIIEENRSDYDKSMIDTLQKMYNSNEHIMGLLSIAETFEDKKLAKYYNTIMEAIKEKKYLKLELTNPSAKFDNVKPIKMVFSDDNWYVAFAYKNEEDKKENFRLGRLSFIKFVSEDKYRNTKKFQLARLKPYFNFLENDLQNAMTFYGNPKRVAKLKATGFIAQYFEKDMKKFFKSQIFKEKLDDNSVVFSIDYTNDLEILPFIQRWLPDIIILEPKELQESYRDKLNKALKGINEEINSNS